MTKLINAYFTDPTLKNAKKLRAYNLKHPFASCLLSEVDRLILDEAVLRAKAEG